MVQICLLNVQSCFSFCEICENLPNFPVCTIISHVSFFAISTFSDEREGARRHLPLVPIPIPQQESSASALSQLQPPTKALPQLQPSAQTLSQLQSTTAQVTQLQPQEKIQRQVRNLQRLWIVFTCAGLWIKRGVVVLLEAICSTKLYDYDVILFIMMYNTIILSISFF